MVGCLWLTGKMLWGGFIKEGNVMNRFGQVMVAVVVAGLMGCQGGGDSSAKSGVSSTDWYQWRGPARNGFVADSPGLIGELPKGGLKAVWQNADISSGFDGGWSSPVVADGRVYLYSHARVKKTEGPEPKRKFPWLPPDKRGHLTAKGYQEYEKNRRDEDEAIAKLYVFRERLFCYDAATGDKLWVNVEDSVYTRFVMSGTVTVVGGKAYLMGAARTARCIDVKTGKEVWRKRLPGEFRDQYMMSSFAVVDGVAVVLVEGLWGLDVKTGKILWQGDGEKTFGVHSSPVVWSGSGRNLVIVNCNRKETICVEPRTGKEVWRVESQAYNATPTIVGNLMVTYGNSRKRGLRCFEISEKGAVEKWVYQGVSDKGSCPVVVGDHVFVQGGPRIACVDLKTGEEKWKGLIDRRRPEYTSLVAADGKVFYGNGGLLCFAADSGEFKTLYDGKIAGDGVLAGEEAHKARLGIDDIKDSKAAGKAYEEKVGKFGPMVCTTPALVKGRMYIRTKRGLICYDLRRGGSAAE